MTLHLEAQGEGAPLLLIHGWGFHSSVWDGFVQPLGRRHRVHLLDLPGHGHSREVRLGSLDALVDAIAPRIPDQTVACGWSMGGLVALRLALRHPHKVRALALIASTPCFVARKGWANAVPARSLAEFARGMGDDPESTSRTFIHLNALGTRDARSIARALLRRLRERPGANAQALQAGLELLRTTDLRTEVPAIHAPTLVVHGARDRIVPMSAGRWLARAIPAACLVELPRSGHLPFVTDREATLAALQALGG